MILMDLSLRQYARVWVLYKSRVKLRKSFGSKIVNYQEVKMLMVFWHTCIKNCWGYQLFQRLSYPELMFWDKIWAKTRCLHCPLSSFNFRRRLTSDNFSFDSPSCWWQGIRKSKTIWWGILGYAMTKSGIRILHEVP